MSKSLRKYPVAPSKHQQMILTWFDQSGRKNLPWQLDKNPYRVWVSEIMLQQTQVSTVIGYFERFICRFPTVETLADASEDEVLHLWTGLGYYQRARNLWRAAKTIVKDYQGRFPNELTELQKLPGIGRSTAGAILSIAFNKKAAILDGNVKRVLTRLYGITEWPGDTKITAQLWDIAEKYTPDNRTADYTQAMMDLGAMICIRGKPRCHECPVQKYCVAHAQGTEKTLPRTKPRKSLPVREATLLVIQKKSHFVLLEKRPPTGTWGSLWSLPEISGVSSAAEIEQFCWQHFRLKASTIQLGGFFRHTFSHFHLDITPAHIMASESGSRVMENGSYLWYNLHENQPVGMPAPVNLLLKALL